MFARTPGFPGVFFDTSATQLSTILPRMDIAVFVGFASSGPLHTPVVVEDMQRFREIFGRDVELAWDRDRARIEKGYLGVSVDSFFRNGGRRCWIVRVADENVAQTARIDIPGLIRVNDMEFEQATAVARSPGAWAESLHVRSILNSRAFQFAQPVSDTFALQINSNGWHADIIASETDIKRGDLIGIQVDSPESSYYLVVEERISTENGLRIAGTKGYFVNRELDASPALFNSALALTDIDAVGDCEIYRLSDFDALGLSVTWLFDIDDDNPPAIQLLSFALRTLEGNGRTRNIGELTFSTHSERFWALLPDDGQLFERLDGKPRKKISAATQKLLDEASVPRFPLAGSEEYTEWTYLPLTMTVSGSAAVRAEFLQAGDRLTRDGLINFGSSHFVDGRLSHLRLDSLLKEANNLAYLANPPAKLRGIHSAFTVDEATLIAVPDAAHRRWEKVPPEYELPLAAPELNSPQQEELLGQTYRLSWNAVEESRFYALQWSEDPDFSENRQVIVGSSDLPGMGADTNFLSPPDNEYFLTLDGDCPCEYFFRVRAENENEISTWSNSRALSVPETDFLSCEYVQAETLELELSVLSSSPSPASPPDEGHQLHWQLSSTVANLDVVDRYELQRSKDKNFFDADIVFFGSPVELDDPNMPTFFVAAQPDTPYYYRVRALARGSVGPWSNTLIIWPGSLSQVTLQRHSDFSDADLLSIHRHLLRIVAARGDLLAVLGLPRHYQMEDALNHYAVLKPSSSINPSASVGGDEFNTYTTPLSIAEQKASSYAALYYPWVTTHVESATGIGLDISTVPPDGLVLGKIAEKTLEQGAWFAPANSPFKDLLALETSITQDQWYKLMSSRINVIRRQSRGHLLMSADTLSTETEWKEINVRRLFSLLKRILLKEGNRLVFESNNEFLRNSIKRQFEALLGRLYDRGAFAGSTTNQAFRVITDDSVNTQANVENGQLVVELHVAPSQPLKFIKVRMLQEGLGQTLVEEVNR